MGKKSKKSRRRDSSSSESTDDSSASSDSRDRRRKMKKHSRDSSRRRSKDRKSSRRRSSSSESDSSVKLLQKLESKRMKEAVERKRRKENLKKLETPEEKRARRLREKQIKENKRRERMGWDNEYQHYTNQDNPFGDAHLTSTFVWTKKLEKKGLKGMPTEELEIINRQKQMENKSELEKVKKRRQEREMERLQREEEMVLLQRSREAAQFEEWERQEDKFHLEQARLRSKIRIQDGRAKPIDLLAQYISNQSLEESLEMQMHEPYTYLNGLGMKDLEDLLVDIKVYIELEKGHNHEYWEDLTVIVQDELQKLKKLVLGGEYHATVGRREGIHQSVARDVTEIFRGKTTVQLEELKRKIEAKIDEKSDGVDIGYWESLLSQLKAHMARARLKDKHQENLRLKLEQLKKEQEPSSDHHQQYDDPQPSTSKSVNETVTKDESGENSSEDDDIADSTEDPSENVLADCFTLYEQGLYSPIYINEETLDKDIKIVNEEDDEAIIENLRSRLLQAQEDDDPYSKEEIRMAKEARKGMGDDEAEFSVETKLDSQIYLWSDKYRPRKPRYFNRVHTGFEWNKYNQTHYDMDNPPPKIVQGYKFNIFYPDLIDKSCTPQYFLTPCNDNKDFALLRFHAGPPYEDLAFKIVNREWEFSYKRGFRCQFQNNIFQLWFHFKRYRYRR
ncbi:Cactin [Pseudolycoriella hygida]|uniref:Splicing factor Cactin n=1 Tax=Pseudolycoriella hygida TaxID=35572 RepID=A0A9Q0S8W4_9DIPT|nr:Cactin [Pseudolycoriella hygida]